MSEEIKESASGELSQGDFKVKKKPKKLAFKWTTMPCMPPSNGGIQRKGNPGGDSITAAEQEFEAA